MNDDMLKWLNMTRIDIKNQGEGNDVKVTVAEGACCNIWQPDWFSKGGAGYVMETPAQHLTFELDCKGAGELLIYMRGIDRRSPDDNRLPLWVDYTRLAVNREVIFWEMKPVWHDRPYAYTRMVEDGEKLQVEVSWALHGYKGEELAQLISLCTKS